jgi:hypothetical protein
VSDSVRIVSSDDRAEQTQTLSEVDYDDRTHTLLRTVAGQLLSLCEKVPQRFDGIDTAGAAPIRKFHYVHASFGDL